MYTASNNLCSLTQITVICTVQLILCISKEPDQIGVSFLSLLGDGLTCCCSLLAFGCSLAAFVSRTLSLCCWGAPPRFSGSSSSCPCCSNFARCSSRSCTRSSMMASRSSWIAWFRWLFFIFQVRETKVRAPSATELLQPGGPFGIAREALLSTPAAGAWTRTHPWCEDRAGGC